MRPIGSHNPNANAAKMERLLEDGINAISADDLKDIHIGDIIYLTGDLTACRDVAHRRVVEEGRQIPVDVRNTAILHAGPIIRPLGEEK